ncbi:MULTISPECIES: LacI family DNA-binding transcriptional regulator [Streptomyces]|uniref:LacI family transcriptional regulator n=2 Tax=Streptomyces TaxID=1883 RepID=A0ABT9KJ21_9ACTN|nr:MULTISPECIES: LacI family DNA-binding transcriptional regulator [Streptomyces]MBW8089908.1 LacI family DNA-binding transcriptional regulator [Streptomyces hygroscopicus subsp. hygroscopicus]MDN3058565.1 LacI family DNA-binding transcriptional regulator [Streptomyces sp. SRF1]MDP9608395.1 LacI family transcriptional regulator [Streptomyces demainii]GHJ30323.1 putative HTH-type transcriptional regulator [Streptomyces hygroscopicus]GLV79282.1 putative HTH-type transcriptional regulator [Strept
MAKVTRDDVARLAGTSTAVVSYVINNGPRPVAPATRERVLAAIKELGYRPDRVAQAMASRRTDLIGLIVPDARQPFFAEMAHAVEQAAAERGKMVLVGNSDYLDEREVHYLRAFLGMRVSGLILISQGMSENAAAEIEAWDARVVLLHERPEAIDDVAVVLDDTGGAQLAVRHLLEHGHEYVACLGGTEITPTVGDPVTDHVEGWRRAMHEAGRTTEGRLFQAPYNRYDAYKVALELLSGPDRPPAIFCATDDQAFGVLRAARELRIEVPGELAVAGFDDVKEAHLTDPPLTTVGSDRPAMARAAVDLVLEDGVRLAGSRRERVKQFPSALVVRRSCGCA